MRYKIIYRDFFDNLLSEINVTKSDIERAEKKYSYDRDLQFTINFLLDNWDEDYVQDWLKLAKKSLSKALRYLGKVPYYDSDDLYRQILSFQEFPSKEQDFFPIAIYVSSKKSDWATIGILVHYNGKLEMFEGNDEATDATYRIVNKLIGNDKEVLVWGQHNVELVRKIKSTGKLPANLYVSPKRNYAQGYWSIDEDKLLFSGKVNLADVRQESDVDWKTAGIIPIKNVKIY